MQVGSSHLNSSLLSALPDSRRRWIVGLGFLAGLGLFLYSLTTVLNGPHQHRQADSAFVGYFYCQEKNDFLHPHVAPRGLTEGTAINEFPVYGAIVGGICRLKGSWDETTPRLVSLIFAFLAALFFWWTLRAKYNLNGVSVFEYLVLFIFLPVNWTFFTIPMPDSTGLFFYAISAFLWTAHPRRKDYKFGGGLSFLLGFLIRPYYILVLFFFSPGVLTSAIVFACCLGLFWFWYRYWDAYVTTVHGYFGIQFQTVKEILNQAPNAIAHLPTRIFEHTAVIGLWAFVLCWKKYRWPIVFYVANVGMMYVLKSTHVAAHAYYLLNAGLFATFVLVLGYQQMSPRQRNYFLAVFLIYTFAFTQHNFHPNRNYQITKAAEAAQGALPANAVIATYLGPDPQWLYYLKRTGYIFEPQDFHGTCPAGATHYLIRDAQVENKLNLERCPGIK